jgi:hypothetical protein
MVTYSNGKKLSSSASKVRTAVMNQRRIQSKKENNLITGNKAARKKVGSKGSIQTFNPEPIKINKRVVRKDDTGPMVADAGGHDRVDRNKQRVTIKPPTKNPFKTKTVKTKTIAYSGTNPIYKETNYIAARPGKTLLKSSNTIQLSTPYKETNYIAKKRSLLEPAKKDLLYILAKGTKKLVTKSIEAGKKSSTEVNKTIMDNASALEAGDKERTGSFKKGLSKKIAAFMAWGRRNQQKSK